MPLTDLSKFIGDAGAERVRAGVADNQVRTLRVPHIHIPPMADEVDISPDVAQAELPVVAVEPVMPAETPVGQGMTACTPRNFLVILFTARDKAHQLHLRTKSFAAHVALGEFYTELTTLIDQLAEVTQGAYGVMDPIGLEPDGFDITPQEFIAKLAADVANQGRAAFAPTDTFILNIVDEIQALIYRAKYKLENLH